MKTTQIKIKISGLLVYYKKLIKQFFYMSWMILS